MRTIIPQPIKEREIPGKLEYRKYTISPEELAKYANLKPPRDHNGEIIKQRVGIAGEKDKIHHRKNA